MRYAATARRAPAMPAPWRSAGRRYLPPHKARGESSVGALLALAYPERIAKNRGGAAGAFLLVNGRGANIDPASPLAREPFLAVAELAGTAAQGRILSAAPITLAEIEQRFSDRIEAREEIAFDAASASLRGRRSRRLGAIALSDQPMPVAANDDTAQKLADGIAGLGMHRLPWTKSLQQWRDRVMFLRASEGEEWPDLSDAALAQTVNTWLAPALAAKTALGEITADELNTAVRALLPWPLQRRLDAEAPTHFAAPTGSQVRDRLRGRGRPQDRDPGPGTVRPRPPSGHCRRQSAVLDRAIVARAPAGADDPRFAGFLARQLRRRARRDARPLPQASVARGPDRRSGDAARQAASALKIYYLKIHPSLSVDLRQP